MTDTFVETEDTFDVDDDFQVPGLERFAPAGGHVETVTSRLRSTYLDTGDQRLLRSRVTLRRREGDDDTGWHLKVPAGSSRTEIHRPVDPAAPHELPTPLSSLVVGLVAGRPLADVATISTTRVRHRVLDADGALLAEVDDDRVEAQAAGADTPVRWREVEVELGRGGRRLLAGLGAAVRAAGGTPARTTSKLARVLAARGAAPEGRAAAAVQAYIVDQVDELVAGDIGLRRGEDPVHATRVAARRFRSTVRVFRELFAADAAAALEAELRWWAAELGDARDAQVQRSWHLDAIAALPPETVMGPVAARVRQATTDDEARARTEIARTLDSPRYLDLLETLREWREAPPFTEQAHAGLGVVRRSAAHAVRQADRRLRRGTRAEDDALLHRARKAAKRARYAHELLQQASDGSGRRRAKAGVKRYKQLQQTLGEHQDAVVAAELLRRLGAAAGAAGENGFTFGVLWQGEQQAAHLARERALLVR